MELITVPGMGPETSRRSKARVVLVAVLLLCVAVAVYFSCSIDVLSGSLSDSEIPGHGPAKTDRPIIDIVTLPVTLDSEKAFGAQTFATSYVRYLQAGGARVAPIFYDSTEEELDSILGKVNGVLWTGSMVEFNPSDETSDGRKYRHTTEYILEYVLREHLNGNYYPLWGTCLGFERLMELLLQVEGEDPILESTDAVDFPINLNLTSDGLRSRLVRNLNDELFYLVTHPDSDIVYNNHGLGVIPETFLADPWVAATFRILSTNEDRNGKEFISSIEGRNMPVYGSQWHPEKNAWEWNPKLHPSHSTEAIEFSNYMGRFFVEECKQNGNSFPDADDEGAALIQNWFSYPTGNWSVFSEVYFFWSPHPNVRPSANATLQQLHPQDPIIVDLLKAIL